MTGKPIIFSGEMVRAILDRRKTQTRRVMSFPKSYMWNHEHFKKDYAFSEMCFDLGKRYSAIFKKDKGGFTEWFPCPYGAPGERLWVREAWASVFFESPSYETGVCDDWYGLDPVPKTLQDAKDRGGWPLMYRADETGRSQTPEDRGWTWRSPRFMPKWASRIMLEVVSVRVERVQDITEDEAKAEGISDERFVDWMGNYLQAFEELWNSINAKRGFPWEENPWVWCVEFKRVT